MRSPFGLVRQELKRQTREETAKVSAAPAPTLRVEAGCELGAGMGQMAVQALDP